jgi:hypothetical protein
MKNTNKKMVKKPVVSQEPEALDVFLMLKENIAVKQLEEIINNEFSDIETEVWPELNVMQLGLADEKYIDFIEMIDDEAFTVEDREYINSKGYKCVYCITHEADDSKTMINVVKAIFEKFDGIVGNDTDDFEPTFDKETINNFNYNL